MCVPLTVDRNEIESVPSTIRHLTHLNLLSCLPVMHPQIVCHLHAFVCVLTVRGNRLKTIPLEVCQLPQLTRLLCLRNPSPDSCANCCSLSRCCTASTVSENDITELPDAFGPGSSLESLDCSGNRIRVIPPTLRQVPHLAAYFCLCPPNSLRTALCLHCLLFLRQSR